MEDQQTATVIKELSIPLYQSRGWMKLLGVVLIINGVMLALSVVGLVICWLPIWLGVLLFKSAGFAEAAQLTGDKMQLMESLQKIKTYFVINGVLMLITLVGLGMFLIISGGAFLSLLGSGGRGW